MVWNSGKEPPLEPWKLTQKQIFFSRKQGLRGQHKFRAEGGHDKAGLPAVRPDQVHQHVLGPGDAEAQGLRLRRVRDTGGGAIGARTDERCDDRWS